MNKLKGHINNIEISGSLSLVSVTIDEETIFTSIVIETPDTAPYLTVGNPVYLLFKETEVILSVQEQNILSIENQIPAQITKIEEGKLLTKVMLHTSAGELTAVIGTRAGRPLDLNVGQDITALVKMNEIMLSES